MSAVVVAAEVEEALAARRPVVALESTIITHGLPRPRNLEVAEEVERIVRAAGAVPATVGVVAGRPTVGLSPAELTLLANDPAVRKASTRELPLVRVAGLNAGTTVAATAFLAHEAGVRVFATGGIGGVHRGASETFDESADLVALSQLPVTVVSAGVKSVLDISATLERLESLGVTVVGFRTSRMPGFFISDSGLSLEWSVENASEVARLMVARDDLGLRSAILVTNPVREEHQLEPSVHDALLASAAREAAARGVRGKAVTPFLLEQLVRASGGATLEANVWAVRNNVSVASEIAAAFAAEGDSAAPPDR